MTKKTTPRGMPVRAIIARFGGLPALTRAALRDWLVERGADEREASNYCEVLPRDYEQGSGAK